MFDTLLRATLLPVATIITWPCWNRNTPSYSFFFFGWFAFSVVGVCVCQDLVACCVCVCVSAWMPNRAKKLCDGEERLQRITKALSALRRLRGNTTLKAFLLRVASRHTQQCLILSSVHWGPITFFFLLALLIPSLQWRGCVGLQHLLRYHAFKEPNNHFHVCFFFLLLPGSSKTGLHH